MSLTTDYNEFLTRKRVAAPPTGFDVPARELNELLFPWQRDIVRWALRRGCAALFAECGLGKTAMQLEWARQISLRTRRPVLILAPLAVAKQTQSEGVKFGIPVTVCRSQSDVRPGVNVANYEMLEHFDPSAFGGVVLDECFAPDTLVEARGKNGELIRKQIKDVRVGDAIISAAGLDEVADVHRREVPYAVRVSVHGNQIICSPNHPFCTQRGWVGAQDLVPGDQVLATSSAVRMVQDAVHGKASAGCKEAVLRDVLLSEVADVEAGECSETSHARSGDEAGGEAEGLSSLWLPEGGSGNRTHSNAQPSDPPGSASEDLPPIERDEPRTFRAWGQWSAFDRAAEDIAGCTRTRMASGVSFVTGPADSGLSHALQNRHRQSQAENRHRSGWTLPQWGAKAARLEEGSEAWVYGVEGIEILEPGHPDLERYRDADGRVYFYDLGATRHPSYSILGPLAGGVLVHNSSILKAFMGKIKRAILEAFAATPYRLACTATPAPNDRLELGNHAEFLGVMPSNEMISRWFINDTMSAGTYRLKGHAEQDFWRWVSTWAVSVSTPADLGHSDAGYVLPPLRWLTHVVEVDLTEGRGDQLFRCPTLSSIGLHAEKRRTVSERAAQVARLVAAAPGAWVVWCDTNYEADELRARLPEAVDLRGCESVAAKEAKIAGFQDGSIRVLISKPSILGFGLNFQHCHQTAFVGLSYSYEAFYQAVRRFWRFGQERPVDAHIVLAESELSVLETIRRKQTDHETMKAAMTAALRETQLDGAAARRDRVQYQAGRPMTLPAWLTPRN